jgi:hypothetical protein
VSVSFSLIVKLGTSMNSTPALRSSPAPHLSGPYWSTRASTPGRYIVARGTPHLPPLAVDTEEAEAYDQELREKSRCYQPGAVDHHGVRTEDVRKTKVKVYTKR